jgi:outer membrane protein assembly factor BamB
MHNDKGIRWWPLGLVFVLGVLALAWIWLFEVGRQRQDRVLLTAFVTFAAIAGTMLWLLLLSRARWRTRLTTLLVVVLLVAGAWFTLKVEAVSGDLVPRVRWKWSQPRDAGLAAVEPAGGDVSGRAGASDHDYPRYRGPRGDGIIDGIRLARNWAEQPPREVWRRDVGSGWSGFAVAGDFAITQEQRGGEERTTCHDLASGEILWSHVENVRHEEALGGPGPRATPAISGERVFSVGATGIVNALDLRTGEPLWRQDLIELASVKPPIYGFASSPVVADGRVVVVAGGREGRSVWAFDELSGEPVWSGGNAPYGYATPAIGTVAGREQWVVLNDGSVNGIAADDGTLLWSHPWPQPTEVTAQPKLLDGDRILVSSGYGVGAKMFKLRSVEDRFEVEILWESMRLKAKFSDFVVYGDHAYGLDDGILTAVSLDDGSRAWKKGRYGHGQFLLVGDLLLIQAEDGSVALVEARPDRYIEQARIEVLTGKTWNHPALAGTRLLVRNDREMVMLELAAE